MGRRWARHGGPGAASFGVPCRVRSLRRGYVPGSTPPPPPPPTQTLPLSRRHFIGGSASAALVWLAGCAHPLPLADAPPAASEPDADRLLLDSAQAHGLDAYRSIQDINIRYDGQWRPLIDRVQPVVVDKRYRGPSEERLLPADGIVAQAYTGPAGRKQVAWRRGGAERPGDISVWYDGTASTDSDVLAASALVAEAYGLFLLGPLWLAGRGLVTRRGGTERVDGRLCDVVQVTLRPGLGLVARDRAALCIDRGTGLTRRVRFTLEGYSGTRGAVAEVDTFDHERHFGVMWPMRSYEEVVHPLRLPAHDWHIAGLDVNRGYDALAVAGPTFTGLAAAPAAALA
jgi:hypothetical protein